MNTILNKLFKVFLVGCIMVASIALNAQESWRKIPLFANGKPLSQMMAIGVAGIATIGDKKTRAFLVLYGKKGSKNINIGVIVENATKFIPENDIDAYRGPDLSEAAIRNNALEIKISRQTGKSSFSTRMVIESTKLFPTDVRGDAEEFFASNVRSTEPERKALLKFLDALGNDFNGGSIVVGRGSFTNVVSMNFKNSGISLLVDDLKTFLFSK